MTSRTLNGWLIHSQPNGEAGLFISILTEEHGLVKTSFPGGQGRKKKANLQLFTPLWIELQQRRNKQYCLTIETKSPPPMLSGLSLYCAYYINELIFKTLKQPETDNQLYTIYEYSILALQQTKDQAAIETLLRQFEWSLLISQGHTYSFEFEGDHHSAIDANQSYQFKPGYGFYISPQGYAGEILLSIAANGLTNKKTLLIAKKIMRQAIDQQAQARADRRSFRGPTMRVAKC